MDSEYRPQNVLRAVMAIFKEGLSSSFSHHSVGVMRPPQVASAGDFATGTLSLDYAHSGEFL